MIHDRLAQLRAAVVRVGKSFLGPRQVDRDDVVYQRLEPLLLRCNRPQQVLW